MKKIIFYSLIILILSGFFSTKTFAQTTCVSPNILMNGVCTTPCTSPQIMVNGTCTTPVGTCTYSGQQFSDIPKTDCDTVSGTWVSDYYFLAPLPDSTNINGNGQLNTSFNPSDTSALGKYLNLMITLIIGIAAVLAVVMIVIGGMQYMTSELISGKEEGKEKIEHALLGLLIALGSYALLYTINPNLLSTSFNSLTNAQVNVLANDNVPQTGVIINGVKNYQTGGNNYATGSNFAQDFPNSSIPTLPNDVSVCASNGQCGAGAQCTTVGQQNCTSTLGLNPSIINAMESDCTSQNNGNPCPIIITAGTEFWLHGTNTSHTPGSSTMDIGENPIINTYIDGNGSNAFPTGATLEDSNTKTCYYAEGAGATAATTGNHWHVYPMSASGGC